MGPQVRVIADDQRNLRGHFAPAHPPQKIHQRVVQSGDENHHAFFALGGHKPPLHLVFARNLALKLVFQIAQAVFQAGEIELLPQEKAAALGVRGMLVGMGDVDPVPV